MFFDVCIEDWTPFHATADLVEDIASIVQFECGWWRWRKKWDSWR
jgi:hypothetical protein